MTTSGTVAGPPPPEHPEPRTDLASQLRGQRTLVVGGGSGIGAAAVGAYADRGASVTVLTLAAPEAADPRATYVLGDATRAPDVQAAIAASGSLDHVTCCVGIFDHYADIRAIDPEALQAAAVEIWRSNVLTALVAASCAYDHLAANRGSLTLTLSGAAFHPHGGGVLYGSTKWALRGVVAHLAKQFAPDVRVNGVAPGGTTDTSLRGLVSLETHGRPSSSLERDERIRRANYLEVVPTPHDHAAAYVYLADPAASRVVTGTVMSTDGGLH